MADVIYRKEALETISNFWNRKYRREHGTLNDAYKLISCLPSAQQWIPCSERLPTKTGHYLCSFKKPNRIDRIYVDLAYWTGGRWYGYMGDEINAWMPLPLPYKEDSNETD